MPPFRREGQSRITRGLVENTAVEILKPQTYMNRSGAALAPARACAEFDAATDLLVLVDDVALPAGRFRLRGAGSAGGHNGLRSIEGAITRQDYARLRIGVGPVDPGVALADFVLAPLPPDDDAQIVALLDTMTDAVECWLIEGIEPAMNQFNR